MVMKKQKVYEKLYRRNELTKRMIIDISMDDYLSFFHEWDNSAFRRRDIHSELVSFLDFCSEDIPLKEKIEIALTLENKDKDETRENQIRQSYFNYYSSMLRLERRKSMRFVRLAIFLFMIALLLLAFYGQIIDDSVTSITSRVLRESLLIGGWVFTWEAVHLIFIDNIEPFRRHLEIKRFVEAELSFKYSYNEKGQSH